MIHYVENLQEPTKKLPEIIPEFSKVILYNKATHNNRLYLYTVAMNSRKQKFKKKKTTLLTIALKNLKYLYIKFTKPLLDLSSQHCKM